MTDQVIVTQTEIVELPTTAVELVEVASSVEIVEVAVQGPPGPQGPQGVQGPVGDADGAFTVTNRFSEIAADEAAKAQARANLDLQYIDGGTFN